MKKLAQYRKFIAALGAGIVVFAAVVSDGAISVDEYWQLAAAIGGPLGVWRVINAPKDPEA